MKKTSTTFLLLICLLFSSVLFAQIKQTARIEYDLEEGGGSRNVFAFKNQKCALYSYFKEDEDDKEVSNLHLESLNENLSVKKTATIPTPDDLKSIIHYTDDNFYYLFNFSPKKGDFILFKIDPVTLESRKIVGSFNLKMEVSEWIVINNKAFLSTIVKKEPVIFQIDLASGKTKTIFPQTMLEPQLKFSDVEKVKTPTGHEAVFQYYTNTKKHRSNLYLLRFDSEGNQLGNFMILNKPDEETEINTVTLTKVSSGRYIATGAYSRNKKGYANGIYFASFDETGSFEFIKYYNFLDINNFTSYLSQRSQDKIEKKLAKAESKGEELNLNYNITIHDIVEKDGKYLFLGEFYYATYRTERTTTYVNGRPTTTTYQVFDGYQYSHAAIASFTTKGEMVWSNSFEMWLNSKPFSVKQFIRTTEETDNLGLLFITGGTIKAISYDYNGKELKNRTIELVSTNLDGDKVKYTSGGDLDFWFDNTFIGMGTQRIKNTEEDEKRKRTVYFINKINF